MSESISEKEQIELLNKKIDVLTKELNETKTELHYLRQLKEAIDKTLIISKTDENGIITDANEMFEKISGYKKEELVGHSHNIIKHPLMPRSIFKKMWSVITKGKIFRGVIRNKKKDGSDYYVLANIIPIKNQKGEIKEYIAIRQDITKRLEFQKQQDVFIENIMAFFEKRLFDLSIKINKYSNLIAKELKSNQPNLKSIQKYNIEIKKEGFDSERMYLILNTLMKLKNKKIEVNIKPINLLSIISFLFKKYQPYYKLNVIFKFNKKPIIINTDEKLITLLIDILYVSIMKLTKNFIVYIYEKDNFIYIKFETDIEIKEKIKIHDFFYGLKHNIKSSINMYLVSKIVNFFEYNLQINEKSVVIKFSIMPPSKFLKK